MSAAQKGIKLVKLKREQVKDSHFLLHSCCKQRLLQICSKTNFTVLLDKTPRKMFDI